MDSKLGIITAALFVFAVFAFLLVFISSKEYTKPFPESESAQETWNEYAGWAIFRENNLYGVINNDDEVIIEAKWDYLYSLGNGSYIVGKKSRGEMYYGAVDSHSNISVPVIYKSVNCYNSELLCAQTFEDNYVLYDMSLSAVTPHEFSFIIDNDNGTYEVGFGGTAYIIFLYAGKIRVSYLKTISFVGTVAKTIEYNFDEPADFGVCDEYLAIIKETSDYASALFFGTNSSGYANELLDKSVLAGDAADAQIEFISLDGIVPGIYDDELGRHYGAALSVSFDIPVPADDGKNEGFLSSHYSVTANLGFAKEFDGNLNLVSCSFSG